MEGEASAKSLNSELVDAISKMDVEKTKELLERGADPNEGLQFLIRNQGIQDEEYKFRVKNNFNSRNKKPQAYSILELLIDFGGSLQTKMRNWNRTSLAQYIIYVANIDLLDFLYKKNPALFESSEGHHYAFDEPQRLHINHYRLAFFLYLIANDLVHPNYTKYKYMDKTVYYWRSGYSYPESYNELYSMRTEIMYALPILKKYIDFNYTNNNSNEIKHETNEKIKRLYKYLLKFFTIDEINYMLFNKRAIFRRRAPLIEAWEAPREEQRVKAEEYKLSKATALTNRIKRLLARKAMTSIENAKQENNEESTVGSGTKKNNNNSTASGGRRRSAKTRRRHK